MIIHGLYKTKEYEIWISIKSRCYYKKGKRYKDYGGRGIRVYRSWIHDAKSFIDYIKSLDNYGVVGLQLDRINNDGNYEPDNLRWTTPHKNMCNQRIRIDNKSGYSGIRKRNTNGKLE